MIDPANVTNYERKQAELEEFLLFCVMVANKNSERSAKALDFLLRQGNEGDTPFQTIRRMVENDTLMTRLVQARTGEYMRRWRTLTELSLGMAGNLANVTVDHLQTIHGIGPKTARFFVINTQRGARYAALDTHILKFLKDAGWPDIPKTTPQKPSEYRRIEEYFLTEASVAGIEPASLDLAVWKQYSGREGIKT